MNFSVDEVSSPGLLLNYMFNHRAKVLDDHDNS